MTVLWEKRVGDTHYRVTRAGNSIRLFTNQVFHSQWNPRNPVTGQLWESLFLPALFVPKTSQLRVLVLGVGGGAVVNLLNRFMDIDSLIGVELDKQHLTVARRWFKAQIKNVDFIHAEAQAWLHSYEGPKFDLIVEDLFMSDAEGEVLRAVNADAHWYRILRRNLHKQGGLIMNFESVRQARRSWRHTAAHCGFKHAGLFTSKRNENAIAIFSANPLDVAFFKSRLYDHPELDIRKQSCKLDYVYRKLKAV